MASNFNISKELLKEFEQNLVKQGLIITNDIKDECVELFTLALWNSVYDYYEPVWYERTYQLLFSVTSEVRNGYLYVYIDDDKLNYQSAVDNRYVTPAVPYWVQEGHNDDTGILNQYHNYEKRDYLSMARDLIKSKYGIEVEIINKKPQWV